MKIFKIKIKVQKLYLSIKRTNIHCFKLGNGRWSSNLDEIRRDIFDFYQNLYTSSNL